MGLVSNEPTNMQGNPTNPGILFRAVDYNTHNADVISGTNYFEGKAVRGKFVGQILMETNWMPAGTVNNIVFPTLCFEGAKSVTGASQDAVSYYDSLKITVYKRQAVQGGYTPSQTTELFIRYVANITNGVGSIPNAEWLNRPSTQPTWFDIRYEYKFVVSVHRLSTNAYLDLESLYLQFHTSTTVIGSRQVTYGVSAGYSPAADPIPIIDGMSWGVGTGASGNFSTTISSEQFNGAGSILNGDYQKGIFNNIQSIITTRAITDHAGDNSSTDYDNSVLTDWQVSSTNGGYEIIVNGYNFGANTTEFFYTMIYGYITPMVV